MSQFLRVAFYARVSSQRQADEKTIQSQREDLVSRIERDQVRMEPGFEYCDDGYTGTVLLRPALEKLRDHIASSMIDQLYVHSPDRLARKFCHQALLLEEFSKHGCKVIFLNQEGLPESPETNLLLQMQGMIAEYEREKILERTRRGRRHAAKIGSVSVFSGAPYGYRYISKHIGEGQARWELNADESPVVQLMFELVDHQRMSLNGICHELQSRGILTSTGKPTWSSSTVRGMLTNPAYCGEAKYGRVRLSQRIPGKRPSRGAPPIPRQAKIAVETSVEDQITIAVPAIVSKSLFERVGQQMEENRKRKRDRSAGPRYLLSGLLICGECGSAFCGRTQRGKYSSYTCIGKDRCRRGENALCDNLSIRGGDLDACVWSELCTLLRDPSRLASELDRRRTEQLPTMSQLQETQRRVNDLRSRLDRLIDAYTSGLLERPEFESRVVPLRDRHDREAAALCSLTGEYARNDATDAISSLACLSEAMNSCLTSVTESQKRELMKLLIKHVEICRNEVRIVYKVPSTPALANTAANDFLQHRLQSHGGA